MLLEIDHNFVIGFGGGPLIIAFFALFAFRGRMENLCIFFVALTCIACGAAVQYLFEMMAVAYGNEGLEELMLRADFWGRIIGTINIGIGISMLVAFFSADPKQEKKVNQD